MRVLFLLTVFGVIIQWIQAEEKQCGVNDIRTMMVTVNQLRAELQENKEKTSALEKELQDLRHSTGILQNQTAALGRNSNQTIGFVAKTNNTNVYCNGTMLFEDIVLNRGGMYDSNTGYFTAPYSAMYLFSLQACIYYYDAAISIVSPTRGAFSQSLFSGSYYYYGETCYSVTTVAHLSQGEQVFANCTNGGTYVQSRDQYWTMFAGASL